MSSVQELAFEKNTFYRDHYRRALRLLTLLTVIAALLTSVLFYVSIDRRQPDYYVTTTSGLVIPIHPLSEPVVTNSYVLEWAGLAVRTAFNIGFVHADQDMQQAQPYFTEGGWRSFQKAMQDAGLLQTVINKKLMMSAVVSGAPVILDHGMRQGAFTWTIQLPLLATFASASETSHEQLIVTMVIKRVPVLDAAKGIQITNFTTQVAS